MTGGIHDSVLLVEDEHALRGLVSAFLRGAGYLVVEAADGPEGVARFADSGPFALAILDLNLPGFSGVEVCRKIREARPDQEVLICSAAISHEAERILAAMGVADLLTKPYHPDILLTQVARMTNAGPRLAVVPDLGT